MCNVNTVDNSDHWAEPQENVKTDHGRMLKENENKIKNFIEQTHIHLKTIVIPPVSTLKLVQCAICSFLSVV